MAKWTTSCQSSCKFPICFLPFPWRSLSRKTRMGQAQLGIWFSILLRKAGLSRQLFGTCSMLKLMCFCKLPEVVSERCCGLQLKSRFVSNREGSRRLPTCKGENELVNMLSLARRELLNFCLDNNPSAPWFHWNSQVLAGMRLKPPSLQLYWTETEKGWKRSVHKAQSSQFKPKSSLMQAFAALWFCHFRLVR